MFTIKTLIGIAIMLLYGGVSNGSLNSMETLRMLHVLYRHGDRAPIKFFPTDIYQNKSSEIWPEGLGQLTKAGKVMEYQLGLWLRNRYGAFIKNVFDPEEVDVISTDLDRTLMSAQCVLAAFYLPDEKTKFRSDLSWMPTPIHTSPKGDDKLLNIDATCPRLSNELSKLQTIPAIKAFYEHHKDLFKRLSDSSGLNLTTAVEIQFLFDTIKIEKIYNLTIPKWAINDYDEMKIVSDFSFKMTSYTRELKRLRGGPLLGMMAGNMRKKSHGDLPKKKMQMFSAHDTTVSVLLNSMGVFNNVSPPYASTVVVELHQAGNNYFVKMFYQNDSSMINEPHPLKIPGCSLECPLSNWTHLLDDVTPKDWSAECYRPNPVLDHYYIVGLTVVYFDFTLKF
ncbi:Lysosomal acid phosphatase, partial [Armadillidium vulgare]